MESAETAPAPVSHLNWVRAGVLLSMLLFFAPFVAAVVANGRDMMVGLVFPAILCIPHLLALPRLFGKEKSLKKGLEGAGNIAVGGMMLWGVLGGLPALLSVLMGEVMTAPMVLLLVSGPGILVHWFLLRSKRVAHEMLWPQEMAVPRHVLGGLGVGFYFGVILFWAAVGLPGLIRDRPRANETVALGSLRTINTASLEYQATYKNSYPPSLASLAVPAEAPLSGFKASCAAADLIDTVLAGGQKAGYVFTYTPGPHVNAPAAGCPPGASSYTVTARPRVYGETGRRSFFTDQTGVIRVTSDDRPATASDPPIS